mmetsp:Transcript_28476/g.77119  ORF Transcript_28476/g.77119 Transcript_28476/m.77119 type:complete len:210 (+) Transcript_28476:818-1447(+)
MSRCRSEPSRTTFSKASRALLNEENDWWNALKSRFGNILSRWRERAATSCTVCARTCKDSWLLATPSSNCALRADSKASSCAAMPSQRSRSAPTAPAAEPPPAPAPPAAEGGAMPLPWMCRSSSAARARVSSPWRTPPPLSPTKPARLPAILVSFAGGGFAMQRRLRTTGAKSASSSMLAMRTMAAFAPQRVLVNCGSEAAASGRSRTL